jgi:cell wall-associated NlpC family hydrolase
MPIQRLAIAAGFFAAILTNAAAFATPPSPQAYAACVADTLQAIIASDLIDTSSPFASTGQDESAALVISDAHALSAAAASDPRQTLVDFAMQLRDIRYRRGGRMPATGFDCSGFVHYVFAGALGIDLPENSASQFDTGMKIARNEMKTGDLVFFHIRGKRISHVGIYLGEGRFIHSPTTGQRVRVDHLDEAYWAHHFAGAKRLDALT